MRHFAEYLSPGILFPEESSALLPERTVAIARKLAPKNAFAFTLYDLPDETPDLGSEFTVIPKRQNQSHRYFIGGLVFTREEVGAWGEGFRILHSNMANDGWDPIVLCRTGNYQPLLNGEIVP